MSLVRPLGGVFDAVLLREWEGDLLSVVELGCFEKFLGHLSAHAAVVKIQHRQRAVLLAWIVLTDAMELIDSESKLWLRVLIDKPTPAASHLLHAFIRIPRPISIV